MRSSLESPRFNDPAPRINTSDAPFKYIIRRPGEAPEYVSNHLFGLQLQGGYAQYDYNPSTLTLTITDFKSMSQDSLPLLPEGVVINQYGVPDSVDLEERAKHVIYAERLRILGLVSDPGINAVLLAYGDVWHKAPAKYVANVLEEDGRRTIKNNVSRRTIIRGEDKTKTVKMENELVLPTFGGGQTGVLVFD